MSFPDPIPSLIPFGTVTLFGGAPGAGKTTLLADWCAAWQAGQPICGQPTSRPTEIVYLAADRSWARYQPLFDRAGVHVRGYSLIDDPTVTGAQLDRAEHAHQLLAGLIARLAPLPGALLVVEPLAPLFLPGSINDARVVASSLVRLRRLTVQLQVTTIATLHFAKQKSDPSQRYLRPQDRFAGSTAFAGFSDTCIYLSDPEPPETEHSTLGWVSRDRAPLLLQITRNTEGRFVEVDPFSSPTTGPSRPADDQLYQLLPPDLPIDRPSLLLACQGLGSVATIKRTLARLIAAGRVTQPRRGVYQRVSPA